MSRLWVKRDGLALLVYDQQGIEAIEKLPLAKALRAQVTQPRNLERLRLYHALVDVCAKGVGVDHETMDDDLRKNLGYYRDIRWPDGRTERRPTSISFENMPDEATFASFFEKAVQAVYTLYGILPKDTQREIDSILAPRTEKTR